MLNKIIIFISLVGVYRSFKGIVYKSALYSNFIINVLST